MSINIKTDKGLVKIAPTSYNELTDLPNIKSNGNTTYITDKSGNNVATIGSGGISTTGIVVDNITLGGKDISQTIAEGSFSGDFKDLTNNPITDNNNGSVSFADASGNKIAAINAEGVESVEFKAGKHKLTEKANQFDVNAAITNLENAAFSGDYNDLENAPIDNINDGTILFTDELGNKIGQIDESGFTSTEFIAGSHKLTNKAEHNAPLANFAEDSEHQLVSSSEKTYWSNKSDFSGKFSDLEENPITDNKDGQIEYQDDKGNTIVRIDSLGISTTAVSINEGDVATLIDGKADKSSLNASNNRISILETKVTNQGSSISQIQSDVDGINGELSTFKSTVEFTYATKTSLSSVDTRVTSAEEEIDVLQSNVDNIQTTVDTHASKVANIESSEGEFVIVDEGSNKGLTLTSDGVLYVKEVGVSGGLVDGRLKSIENYFSTEEDADNNLNKWNEIVNFLNGFEETDQALENIIATKADKSTVTSLESAYKTADTNLGTRIDGIITDVNRKQDIISDLATIRSGAAKGATALQSYTETDPVFKASAAANITTTDITNWNNKTSNSGTITEVKANGTSIATSGSANIPAASTSTYGVTKLSSSTSSTSEVLAATPKAVKAAYDLAASKTSNIGTITGITMNGVSKGTSGVVDLGTVVTNVSNLASKTELTDAINNIDFYSIKDNPIIEEASGTLTFVDPSGNIGFVFEGNSIHVQDVTTGTHTLSNKQDKLVSGTNIKTINGTSILGSGNINITGGSSITESTISGWGFTKNTGTVTGVKINGSTKNPSSGVVDLGTVITSHQDISGKADKSSLATVATSGSYNDLSNKPTIPSAVTESTVSGWGFTKNSGTYSKPSGGIPKSDLASAVQTSLGKADTALQSHQDISGKQDKLVSGTNIKTINGLPILGNGNLVVSHKPLTTTTAATMSIAPNGYYRNTNTSLSSLTISLTSESNTDVLNEYFVEFTTSASGTTISLPNYIKWKDGKTPVFEAGVTYQISIVNNLGIVAKFS